MFRFREGTKEAFNRPGANASFDDVAKEASVEPGTLYPHFQTREGLLRAVFRSALEMLASTTKVRPLAHS
jgi:AcrR family transcriptional regulator